MVAGGIKRGNLNISPFIFDSDVSFSHHILT